jgi:hypothetical protein
MQMILHDADPAAADDEAARAREALQAAFVRASGAFEEMSPTLDGDLLRFTHPEGPMRLDELYRALEDERVRKDTLLEERDRELIEQLMLREVVDAIRAAIAQTRRWVDEVNRILGGMQLFKGGIMRLHWEVRPPEKTDAFDPRRLDDLLSQRGIALDEARRGELLEIFRTMIADVRRRNRENELLEDYRTALLRMVDYTQWYSLTVQRRDESGRWAPLTRRLYGQGSGGRRTLICCFRWSRGRLGPAGGGGPRGSADDRLRRGVRGGGRPERRRDLRPPLGAGILLDHGYREGDGIGPQVRGSATYELPHRRHHRRSPAQLVGRRAPLRVRGRRAVGGAGFLPARAGGETVRPDEKQDLLMLLGHPGLVRLLDALHDSLARHREPKGRQQVRSHEEAEGLADLIGNRSSPAAGSASRRSTDGCASTRGSTARWKRWWSFIAASPSFAPGRSGPG